VKIKKKIKKKVKKRKERAVRVSHVNVQSEKAETMDHPHHLCWCWYFFWMNSKTKNVKSKFTQDFKHAINHDNDNNDIVFIF